MVCPLVVVINQLYSALLGRYAFAVCGVFTWPC
nr:MAG TPA: hypothetical protein [Bacteriophage sp.]